jgi:hypothetical protein
MLAAAPQGVAPAVVTAAFEYANSLVLQPLDWLGLRHTSELGLTLVRSSKTHTHHHRHLIPPPSPMSHSDFSAMFVLWYHLLAFVPPLAGEKLPRMPTRSVLGCPIKESAAPKESLATRPDTPVERDEDFALYTAVRGDALLAHFVGSQLEVRAAAGRTRCPRRATCGCAGALRSAAICAAASSRGPRSPCWWDPARCTRTWCCSKCSHRTRWRSRSRSSTWT